MTDAERIAALEKLIGDIMDGCINPLTAAAICIESRLLRNVDDPHDQTMARLISTALDRFVAYRAQWEKIPRRVS